MTYLFAQYWIFIALAFLLGMFVGWATCGGAALGDWRDRWYGWGIAAFLAGCFIAVFKWLPGLPGHLLEIALLLFGAYVLGCVLGCNGRWGFGDAPRTADDAHPATSDHAVHAAKAAVASAAAPVAVAAAPAVAGDIFSVDSSASYPGARPAALSAPRGGKADGLTGIAGLDEGTAKALGDIGVFHHDQIAGWAAPQTQWVEHHLAQSGRIGREDWIEQAKRLAGGAGAGAAAGVAAVATAAAAPSGGASVQPAPAIAQTPPVRQAPPTAESPADASASTADAGAPAAGAATPPDDLKLIKGIGPKNQAALNAIGVTRFVQIGDWTPDAARKIGETLQFPGRIEREHWIEQARLLAAGVDTAHSTAVKAGALTIDHGADAPLSDAEAQALAQALPKQAARVADEWSYGGSRPLGLAGPRGGKADDLKLIKGVGKQNEERLHQLGIWHFDQIAGWSPANVQWIGSYLAFHGRIDREHWLEQASLLARGETTEFARRVAAGEVPTSKV